MKAEKSDNRSKKIIVAPLNWGLGHATRCIPIIKALEGSGYQVVIASDGDPLSLLAKEFPGRECLELPSYNVRYPRNGWLLKLKLMARMMDFKKVMKAEASVIAAYIAKNQIDGIISDNRFGVHNKAVTSVFITHQVRVLSGSTTWLSSRMHRQIIDKFDECWIPDLKGPANLSGKMGHPKKDRNRFKYIGTLSRLKKKELPIEHDILCLLSGPEPQRSLLERCLLDCFADDRRSILLVRGVINRPPRPGKTGNVRVVDYLTSAQLEQALNASRLVICRSGYSTLMDLAKLEKKAFLIPTPGQFEQQYLAKRLKEKGIAPYCEQADFDVDKLHQLAAYSGFKWLAAPGPLSGLFGLFEGE